MKRISREDGFTLAGLLRGVLIAPLSPAMRAARQVQRKCRWKQLVYFGIAVLLSCAALASCSQTFAVANVCDRIPLEDFIVQAHRGAGLLAPENTLPTYELSWNNGYTPEADVRFTADGTLIGFHDGNLSRVAIYAPPAIKTTPISQLTWSQLWNIDVGSYFAPQYSYERIPTMSLVFSAMQGHPDRRLYLDLKTTDLNSVQSWVHDYGVESQLIVASSDYATLQSWKDLSPTSSTLYWMGGTEAELTAKLDVLRAADFQDVDQLQIHVTVGDLSSPDPFTPTSAFLQSVAGELQTRGVLFQVFPFHGDEAHVGAYSKLMDLGVESFATDYPDVALGAVSEYYSQHVPEPSTLVMIAVCAVIGALTQRKYVKYGYSSVMRGLMPMLRKKDAGVPFASETTSRLPTIIFRAIILPLCILGTCAIVPVLAADNVKVMTFNILNDGKLAGTDQAKSWNYYLNDDNDRRDRAVSVINAFAPDILGIQEMLYLQLSYLNGELSGYGYYGVGNGTGGTEDGAGSRNGIFYRADRFSATDQGEFWLSDTPGTPGTTFSTASVTPRMVTWIKLHDQQAGDNYFVMNTHWAYGSHDSPARVASGELMRDKINELSGGLPIIITGDLNDTHTDTGYSALLNGDPGEVGLTDSYDQTGEPQGKTYHGFLGGTEGSRIDHVFHSTADFQAIDAGIVRTTLGGYYPSDHYAVTATLLLVPEPSSIMLLLVTVMCVASGCFVFIAAIRRFAVSSQKKTSEGNVS